ncbi:hypothetical protein QQZ08_009506 [Neonectria magnoliae]|uniref:Uncharacterized protein n=1 Tax=Neonectria magnoliae TaxID=2732573 RepID=A0ABR1HMV4_9HYPO
MEYLPSQQMDFDPHRTDFFLPDHQMGFHSPQKMDFALQAQQMNLHRTRPNIHQDCDTAFTGWCGTSTQSESDFLRRAMDTMAIDEDPITTPEATDAMEIDHVTAPRITNDGQVTQTFDTSEKAMMVDTVSNGAGPTDDAALEQKLPTEATVAQTIFTEPSTITGETTASDEESSKSHSATGLLLLRMLQLRMRLQPPINPQPARNIPSG